MFLIRIIQSTFINVSFEQFKIAPANEVQPCQLGLQQPCQLGLQ
jgi:hypothetical protein